MKYVARFEKVTYAQFKKDWKNTFGETYDEQNIQKIYDKIKLPRRATSGSAGYDILSPFIFILKPNETIKIPTGLRVIIDENWALKCYPRSGLGFKYRLELDNTVGIIDSDYSYSDNEGHIFFKITNNTKENKTVYINEGDGFAQGVFEEYGITVDDDPIGVRNGGFGSTDK